ncbi:MAG: hypothetical protein R2729_32520 [Bryobacteraceae bacterium]
MGGLRDMDGESQKSLQVRPDDVIDGFAEGSVVITTRMLQGEDGDVRSVEIEGDAETLRYLGRLFLAQADYPADCGFGLSPRSGGYALFSANAEVGIYIHRLPCMDEEEFKARKTPSDVP